jgi:DNA-binding LacI/PurR family transcriptional regulator
VVAGEFDAQSRLPVAKQLTHRYGIGAQALQRALRRLCHERILEKCQRGYRSLVLTATGHRVFLVTIGNAEGIHDPPGNWRGELLRQFEYQCHQHGLQLQVFVFPFTFGVIAPSQAFYDALISSRNRPYLSGTVVLPLNLTEPILAPVADAIRRAGRPAVVLDEVGTQAFRNLFAPPRAFAHFAMSGGRSAGQTMARFLLSQGHRHFAWISAQADSAWSANRRAGFEETVGRLAGTSVETAEIPESSWLAGPQHEADRYFNKAARAFDEWERHRDASAPMWSSMRFDVQQRMGRFAGDAAMTGALEPLLERLLRNQRTTVWVASNDSVASTCLRFLQQRRVAVPDTLSIAGFDDSDVALSRRLTSYNFNCAGVARAVVARLVRHEQLGPAGDSQEVEGFVISRETTRPLTAGPP